MARALQIAACALTFCALATPVALADPPDVSVTISGTLQRTHVDTDTGPRAVTFLSTANGPQAVTFAPDQPVPPNGAEVDLTGRLTGATLETDSVDVTGPTIAVPTTVPGDGGDGGTVLEADQGTPLASGAPRKVAIVVITFSNGAGATPPGTDAQLRGVLVSNPNSVSNYFSEQSFGAVSFTGTSNSAGDVYRVSIPADGSGCNGDSTHDPAWMTWGTQAATAAGLSHTAGYDHVIYYFTSQGSCGWAGLGYMPGDEVYIDNAFSLSVVSHELGHNLGVHHASTLRCVASGANVAFTSANRACSSDEYGDMYDIMGKSATNQQNAFHKLQSGWLGTSTGPRVTTITTSGDYTVGPLEASSGVALLLIPHVTAGLDSSGRSSFGSTFALDYRQPTGSYFDTFASAPLATNSVQIRLVQTPGSGSPIQTQLIDTNPQTATFADAGLTQNATFTDSTDGITIQTTDVNPLGATVHVTFGSTGDGSSTGGGSPGGGTVAPPDTTPPSGVASLAASVASGPVVSLAFAPATDDRAVSSYRITRDGSQIENLAGTQTAYADWTATYGSHTYGVTAVDASGNAGPMATVVAVVSPPVPPKPSTKSPTTPGSDPGTSRTRITAHSVKVTVKAVTKAGKRRVTLSWKKVAGARKYAVTRNGRSFRTTSAVTLVDTSPPRGTLRYLVTVTS